MYHVTSDQFYFAMTSPVQCFQFIFGFYFHIIVVMQLLNELSDAWQITIHRRLGVFSVHNADDGEVLPLIVSDQIKYSPPKCNTGPHQLWSQVIARVYICVYSDRSFSYYLLCDNLYAYISVYTSLILIGLLISFVILTLSLYDILQSHG